jgi:hypothetical protein
MLLVLVGSASLIWWSVNRLTLANRQLRQKTSTVSALADEVQRLERASQPPDVALLDSRVEQAKKLLFAGPADYAAWEKDLREQALPYSSTRCIGKPGSVAYKRRIQIPGSFRARLNSVPSPTPSQEIPRMSAC